MGERGVGKPWTTYEDKILIQAVAVHGENDNWKAVAASIPGRTNKACRKRWLHSLSPNVKKTAWTPEEDQLLLSLFATHGTKWSIIARNIPGRTDDACSKRYREALDPSLKRDDWTADEDAKLIDAYSRLGGKWGVIGQELNRSGLGSRNRWRMLERRKAAHSRDGAQRGELASPIPGSSDTPSQWTPTHVQDAQIWDGRSPQYVTPSALFQGSPLHSQDSHATPYSPAQILSGAHLSGPSSSTREQLQSSPSVSAAPSNPNTVPHSPSPQGCEHPTSDSHDNGPAELSAINLPDQDPNARTYESADYDFMHIEDENNSNPAPETYQRRGSPIVNDISSANVCSQHGSPIEPVFGHPIVPSDSPASPSQAGSRSPSSPRALSPAPGNQSVNSTIAASDDPGSAPRSYYRTEQEKAEARKALASRVPTNQQRPARLSSILPATMDASVQAYACGHRDCWPVGALSSKNAFVTSKELTLHSKADHQGDLGGSKPFRCGLTECEKSWKSINGLQYHLQISRYHFQQALARTDNPPSVWPFAPDIPEGSRVQMSSHPDLVTAQGATTVEEESGTSSRRVPAREVPREKTRNSSVPKTKRKLHPCPHAGCDKQYKQLSGLRYHLAHGHVDALPTQLDVVPPMLARMVAEKGSSSAPRG